MSITTKSHMIKVHSGQQRDFSGIRDLAGDFGEQNHQYQYKTNKLLASICSFARR